MFPLLGQISPDQVHVILDGGTKGLIMALVVALITCVAAIVYLAKRLYDTLHTRVVEQAGRDAIHATKLEVLGAEHNKSLLAMTERVIVALTSMGSAAEALRAATETSQETVRLLEYVIDNPPGSTPPPVPRRGR